MKKFTFISSLTSWKIYYKNYINRKSQSWKNCEKKKLTEKLKSSPQSLHLFYIEVVVIQFFFFSSVFTNQLPKMRSISTIHIWFWMIHTEILLNWYEACFQVITKIGFLQSFFRDFSTAISDSLSHYVTFISSKKFNYETELPNFFTKKMHISLNSRVEVCKAKSAHSADMMVI